MSRKLERQIARAQAPKPPKLTPEQELVQLKAWQYEATVQVQLWTQRGQQLHAVIVEREGPPKHSVIAPTPPAEKP